MYHILPMSVQFPAHSIKYNYLSHLSTAGVWTSRYQTCHWINHHHHHHHHQKFHLSGSESELASPPPWFFSFHLLQNRILGICGNMDFLTNQMSFLSSSQWCQNTEHTHSADPNQRQHAIILLLGKACNNVSVRQKKLYIHRSNWTCRIPRCFKCHI